MPGCAVGRGQEAGAWDVVFVPAEDLGAVRAWRRRDPVVPLIAVAASGDVDLASRVVEAGASDLLVLGRLEGNVFAQRLHLQASARILGNIETQSLQVDPGAHYQGSVTMVDPHAPRLALPQADKPANVDPPADA